MHAFISYDFRDILRQKFRRSIQAGLSYRRKPCRHFRHLAPGSWCVVIVSLFGSRYGNIVIIHADHVVQSAWILFSLWMYVCMYVSALERKRLIGMT